MTEIRLAACVLGLFASSMAQAQDQSTDGIELQLSRASSVCLVKITGMETFDERPSDGDKYNLVKFKVLKGSGRPPRALYLVIRHGGFTPTGYPPLPTVLKHDSLTVGEKHWFVFGNDYDAKKYPIGVVNWFSVDQEIPDSLSKAIESNRYSWNPVYDSKTGIIYGTKFFAADAKLEVRAWKDGKRLWVQKIKGSFESIGRPYLLEVPTVKTEKEVRPLYLTILRKLKRGNEFDLSAGNYRFNYEFDLKTGEKISETRVKYFMR